MLLVASSSSAPACSVSQEQRRTHNIASVVQEKKTDCAYEDRPVLSCFPQHLEDPGYVVVPLRPNIHTYIV